MDKKECVPRLHSSFFFSLSTHLSSGYVYTANSKSPTHPLLSLGIFWKRSNKEKSLGIF